MLSIGAISLFSSYVNITSNIIGYQINKEFSSFIPMGILLAGVIAIFMSGRREHKESGLSIYISNDAIEKSRKDQWVRQNLGRFVKEIRMIEQNPHARPQERMGEFTVSPRGHTDVRVAWHYDREKNELYIDDFLRHETRGYAEKWDQKVIRGKIKKETYKTRGYQQVEKPEDIERK